MLIVIRILFLIQQVLYQILVSNMLHGWFLYVPLNRNVTMWHLTSHPTTYRQSHIKKTYLHIRARSSAILRAHLLGKIDATPPGLPLHGSGKTAKTNQFFTTNVRSKLLKSWTSQYLTFCRYVLLIWGRRYSKNPRNICYQLLHILTSHYNHKMQISKNIHNCTTLFFCKHVFRRTIYDRFLVIFKYICIIHFPTKCSYLDKIAE